MKPEDLEVGKEYTTRSSRYVYTYIGPLGRDGLHVFERGPGFNLVKLGYTVGILQPKPHPFFEEGKTYRREPDDGRRYTVESVRTDYDSNRTAFGLLTTGPDSGRWVTRHSYGYDEDSPWGRAWKEVEE